jgi:hypothetical protein
VPAKVNRISTQSPVSDGTNKQLRDPFMLPETHLYKR